MKSYDDVKITETSISTRTDGTEYSWTSDSISLEKLTDKKIVDVGISIHREFGEPGLSFHRIIFEDGSTISLEGEHDLVYMNRSRGEFPTLKTNQLAALYNESNDLTSDDEDYLDTEDYDDDE